MFWNRLKHKLFLALMRFFMNLAGPTTHQLFSGEGSSRQLGLHMARSGLKKVFVVTDKPLVELGIAGKAMAGLEEAGVEMVVFDGVEPDPTYEIVELGRAMYAANQCDSILAIGGGSSIDAAKIMGLALTHPGSPQEYVGFGKVKESIPPFYAIPTTSGTGSEATMGAVISDTVSHEKAIISGGTLLPLAACLDAELMVGMPPGITAATGMDAMTHAIEAYIGQIDRGDCQEKAAQAVRILFDKLPQAYATGSDIVARDAVAHAAYMAGQAINQVNVGNVHAIAHQLGGKYGIPHGLANAMVLPHVLELSLEAARPKLTELAALIGLGSAEAFVAAVSDINTTLSIPGKVEALVAQDFSGLVERAVAEGATYPVPYLMSPADVTDILRKLLPES